MTKSYIYRLQLTSYPVVFVEVNCLFCHGTQALIMKNAIIKVAKTPPESGAEHLFIRGAFTN